MKREQGLRRLAGLTTPLLAVGLVALLVPGQVAAQSCYGGYCGSGDGVDWDAKVEVTVTVSVVPEDAGFVLINGEEPEHGVFTALQGDTLNIEAVAENGYTFVRWSEWFDESKSSVEAPIYNHKTLVAHFAEEEEEEEELSPSAPSDERTSEWIPEGTVARDRRGKTLADITVDIRQPRALPSNGVLVGDVYDFKPDGATFDPPLPLSLPYDTASVPAGTDETELVVALYDPEAQDWIALPSVVNRTNMVVETEVSHFSEFAVMAPMVDSATPLITPGFSFSSLSVSPATAYAGQDVMVTVEASYVGANAQAKSLVFVTLNGEVADETEIVLSPGDHVKVALTVRPPQDGTYTVELNGMADTITVSGSAPASALTQAVALVETDTFAPLDAASPSVLARWRIPIYIGAALLLLLLVGPMVSVLRRRILRYRYDL
ncbi:MAG: hypothetical protein GX600_03320 [Dehalococcoidia bacterium]|jgi:hypothetical protein|nr:hypothetical protein [Dehalococcoidia bacterium]